MAAAGTLMVAAETPTAAGTPMVAAETLTAVGTLSNLPVERTGPDTDEATADPLIRALEAIRSRGLRAATNPRRAHPRPAIAADRAVPAAVPAVLAAAAAALAEAAAGASAAVVLVAATAPAVAATAVEDGKYSPAVGETPEPFLPLRR